jgi:hypothetical protein
MFVSGGTVDAQPTTVVRRFNDFVWLRDQLRDALPFLIVPSLPEKQQIGRFNQDFVEVRLRALQRWVDRIAVHPDVVTTGACAKAEKGKKKRRQMRRKEKGGPQTLLLTPGSPLLTCSPRTLTSHPDLFSPLHPPSFPHILASYLPLLPPSLFLSLLSADPFRKFISFPPEAFAGLRDSARTEKVKGVAEEGKKQILKLVKTASVAVQGAIAQARGAPNAAAVGSSTSASKTAEDLSFADLETYLLGQAPLLTALYNESASVAVRAREQAQLLLDFGASLRSLGQAEGGPLGTSLASVGLASWAASTAAYEQAVCETELFVEKLADYVRGTRAVKECVESRGKASAELAEAVGEVERLRALIVALGASPTANAIKDKAQAEIDLQIAQKVSADTRAAYDKCAAGVIAEVERLRAGMRADFQGMALDFIAIQVRTELKLAAAWERIANDVATNAAAEGAVAGGGALGGAIGGGAAGGAAAAAAAASSGDGGAFGGMSSVY